MVSFAGLVAILAAGTASAAGGADTSSPQASKEGGIAGDPRGAIRALGGDSKDDFRQHDNQVKVPALGGEPGAGRVGGPPPGATGPR